jgi:hypothetical protein
VIGAIVSTFTLVLVLAPAPAVSGAARAPVSLTAVPARVSLAGTAQAAIRVTNAGTRRVLVDVARAGFALDLRGRPRIVRRRDRRSAARWLAFRPARLMLPPQSSASLTIASKVPRRAEPGDHDAVLLLSTAPVGRGRVAVRVRMGVVVVVRVPGRVVRRLELRGLRVGRRRRTLELLVANRGNVTESLHGARLVLSSSGRARTLVAGRRDVRPRTRGIVEFRLPRGTHGRVAARVVVPGEPGRSALRRTYRIRV